MLLSANSSTPCKESIYAKLNVVETNHYGKYLGLPSFVGWNKKDIFTYIKERVWLRIQSWDCHFLSKAGKEILIKTVAQALPNYAISVFLLPKDLCAKLEHILNSFW